jgi:hypothetical protein
MLLFDGFRADAEAETRYTFRAVRTQWEAAIIPIKELLADDTAIIRRAIRGLLENRPEVRPAPLSTPLLLKVCHLLQ